MNEFQLPRVSYSCLALLLVLNASCSKPRSTEDAPPAASTGVATDSVHMRVELSQRLSPEQIQQANALAESVNEQSWTFGSSDGSNPANAPLFAYLAVTSDRPEVIGAAIKALAMAEQKAPAGSEGQALSRPDLEAVLGDSLTSSFPRIQGRALEAVSVVLRKHPNSALGKQAVALLPSFKTAAAQYDLLKAIAVVPPAKKRQFLNEFLALQANLDPLVTATLMEELTTAWANGSPPTALITSATTAMQHQDPIVRGTAARFLGTAGSGRPTVQTDLIALLGKKDESPYVLSEAATALARLGSQPAVHALVPLLDDKRSTRVEAPPWKTLEGTAGRKVLGGPSDNNTVGLAALQALTALSRGELKPEPPDPKAKDLGLARDVTAAKSWYASNKGKIPKDVAEPPKTTTVSTTSAPSTKAAPSAKTAPAEKPAP